MFSNRRRLLFAFLALVLTACQKEQRPLGPPPRFAVVRFENLTGDPSLEWTGRASSEVLSVSLQPGVPDSGVSAPMLRGNAVARFAQTLGTGASAAPGISTERSAALLAGANRIVSGYVERAGSGIRITASVENPSTGRIVRTISAADGTFDGAIRKLALQFSPKAAPYLTDKPAAIRAYTAALDESLEPGARDFNAALEADPDFGPAWISRATLAAGRGDRTAFTQTVAEARTHKLDPYSRAQLDLEEAAVRGDNAARIAALRKVVDLSAGDLGLLRTLADTETAAGDFKPAAADFARLTELSPEDASVWNSLGYARSYTGDYPGAQAAVRQYGVLRPADPNASDSLGDIHYTFGKFAEAAAAYAEATQKDPNFERSADLYKAAWAKFRSGDKAAADKLMDQFRAAREKQSDPLTPLLVGDWLYRTGRVSEATALLRQLADKPKTPADRGSALSQLAAWELISGDRAKAAADVAAMGRPASPSAVLIVFSAMPSAPAAEWEARSQRMFADPRIESLRRSALAYALLLDGKRDAALPVWREIAAAAPADFFQSAIVARLEGRKPERELVPAPNSVNQFRALLDRL